MALCFLFNLHTYWLGASLGICVHIVTVFIPLCVSVTLRVFKRDVGGSLCIDGLAKYLKSDDYV